MPRTHSRSSPVPAFALYGEPQRATGGRMVHVERIAVRSEVRAWNIRPHQHRDFCQILLAFDGGVQASVDGREYALGAPSVVFLPPGAVHAFRFRPGTDGVVVTFSQGLVQEELRIAPELAGLLDAPIASTLEPAAELALMGRQLLEEFEGSAAGRSEMLWGLLGVVLTRVLRIAAESSAGNRGSPGAGRILFRRFRDLVERHHRSHLPVARYAALLGVSEARLRRCCLELGGQAPGELVHLRQLREAQRQLHYTTRSVALIAWDLGFKDPAYFSRFFARRTGVSPRGYRQRSAAAAGGPMWV